jgi:hypothetical protein
MRIAKTCADEGECRAVNTYAFTAEESNTVTATAGESNTVSETETGTGKTNNRETNRLHASATAGER